MALEQIEKAIRRYCAYQERCHQEVRNKLFELGARGDDIDICIAELISEDFINEERYARAYVRGHFYLKKWGKVKIVYELKRKGISNYCIQKGLTEIDEAEYINTIQKLIAERLPQQSKRMLSWTQIRQITQYLQQKGYDYDDIQNVLKVYTNS
jgi:regulatory protein